MAYALDTLGYAKRLRDAGVPADQAEAHAEAAREFIMAELVTKPDLLLIRQDVAAVRQVIGQDVTAVRQEMMAIEQRLTAAMQTIELRLTVRLGGAITVAIAILAAIIKL